MFQECKSFAITLPEGAVVSFKFVAVVISMSPGLSVVSSAPAGPVVVPSMVLTSDKSGVRVVFVVLCDVTGGGPIVDATRE